MSIKRIQESTSLSGSGGTRTVTIATPTAGNSLVLFALTASSGTVTAVSGAGCTWTKIDTLGNHTVWFGENSSGSGTTLTLTVSNSFDTYYANCTEWSGMPSALSANGGSQRTQTSVTTGTTPTVTPSGSGPVLMVAICTRASASYVSGPTGGGSFNPLSSTAGTVNIGYKIVEPPSGGYAVSWTYSFNGNLTTGLYGFNGASLDPESLNRAKHWFNGLPFQGVVYSANPNEVKYWLNGLPLQPVLMLGSAATNLLVSPLCSQLNLLTTTQTAGAQALFFPLETRSQLSSPVPAGGFTFTAGPVPALAQLSNPVANGAAAVTPPPLPTLTQLLAGTTIIGAALTPAPLQDRTQFNPALAVAGAALTPTSLQRTNQLAGPTPIAGSQLPLTPLATLAANLTQPILAGCQLPTAALQDYIQLSNPTVGSQVVVAMPAFMVQLNLTSTLLTGGAAAPVAALPSVVKFNNPTTTGGVTVATTSLNCHTQFNIPTVTAGATLTPPAFRSVLIVQTGPIELNQPIFLNMLPLVVEPTLTLTGQLRPPQPLICYAVTLQSEFSCEVVVQPEFNLDVEFQEC